jgi:hypothetical protein
MRLRIRVTPIRSCIVSSFAPPSESESEWSSSPAKSRIPHLRTPDVATPAPVSRRSALPVGTIGPVRSGRKRTKAFLGHSAKTVSAARCFAFAGVRQAHPFAVHPILVDLRVILVERRQASLDLWARWSCWTSDNKGRSSHRGGMWRDSQRTASFAHIETYGQCNGEAPIGYIAPPYALI